MRCQVSREIPLKYNLHYKHVAFVSGLDIAMLPVGAAAATAATAQPAAAGIATRAVLHADIPQSLQPPQPQTPHRISSSAPARLLLKQQTPSASAKPAAQPPKGPAAATTTAAAAVLPAGATAAVLRPAGSDFTGSLAADADADEFSWHAQLRAPDVNKFSWVATAPSPALRTSQHRQHGASVTSPSSAVAGTPAPSSSQGSTGEEQQGLLPQIGEGAGVLLGSWTASSDLAGLGVPVAAAEPPAAAAATGAAAAAGQGVQMVPHVLVSYGSGDWESRLAVLTLQEVDDMFEPIAT
jgi:hypothetical protein